MSAAAARFMVVVAHPDDETFGCGSLLLYAADHGMETVVVCATRGEAGEAVDGTAPDRLGAVREAETRAAAAALGVESVVFLGFRDSGMSGEARADTLVGASFDDVRDRVREQLERFSPAIVVSLDGADGHRDHRRIGEATVAAVESLPVERVYLHGVPQSLIRRWVEHQAGHDPNREHLSVDVPGTPDTSITTVLDTSAYLAARERAIALHTSQRSPFDGLPDDLRRAFLTTEHLHRVRPAWTGGPPETSLG